MLVPHGVASVAGPVPTQTCLPVEHEVWPAWQGFASGLHGTIAAHARHAPLRHTWLVPHKVPSVAGVPVSSHVACPPEHAITPTSQGLLEGTQDAPGVQGEHIPSLQ